MENYNKEYQVVAVSRWWNLERNYIKWRKAYEQHNIHGRRYLISRQNIVIRYLDDLELDKDSNILELGYGAGQVAQEIERRGFNTYGLDISSKFSKTATNRCTKSHPNGFFDLRVGSIESKFEFENERLSNSKLFEDVATKV